MPPREPARVGAAPALAAALRGTDPVPTPTETPTAVFTPADEPPPPTWTTGSIPTPEPEAPSRLWMVLVPLGVLVVAVTIVVALVLGGFGTDPDSGSTMPPVPTPAASVAERRAAVGPTRAEPSPTPTRDPRVVVPNVVGDRRAAAAAELDRRDLKTTFAVTCRRGGKPGRVATQKPAAGTTADPGDRVALQVQATDCVVVPDVRGRTINQARETLFGLGFRDVPVDSPPGLDWNYARVIKQRPAPGAHRTSERALVVSDGRGVDDGRGDGRRDGNFHPN